MEKEYRSNHLRIVIQAFHELGVKVTHRSQIIKKWREIKRKAGTTTDPRQLGRLYFAQISKIF